MIYLHFIVAARRISIIKLYFSQKKFGKIVGSLKVDESEVPSGNAFIGNLYGLKIKKKEKRKKERNRRLQKEIHCRVC